MGALIAMHLPVTQGRQMMGAACLYLSLLVLTAASEDFKVLPDTVRACA
jgi:hypothetical protein